MKSGILSKVRRISGVMVLCMVIISLTGCVKVNYTLELKENGRVSLTYQALLSDEFATMGGEDLQAQIDTALAEVGGDTTLQAAPVVKDVDGKQYSGLRFTRDYDSAEAIMAQLENVNSQMGIGAQNQEIVSDVPLSSGQSDEMLRDILYDIQVDRTKGFAEDTLTMTIGVNPVGSALGSDTEMLSQMMDFTFDIKVPGDIVECSAQYTSDNTVHIDMMTVSESTQVRIVTVVPGGIWHIVVCTFLLVLLLWFMWWYTMKQVKRNKVEAKVTDDLINKYAGMTVDTLSDVPVQSFADSDEDVDYEDENEDGVEVDEDIDELFASDLVVDDGEDDVDALTDVVSRPDTRLYGDEDLFDEDSETRNWEGY